jgi:glycosyltransferase involved in cell wall biosynthesis
VLRRSVATGAVVHASSHATAEAVRELMPGATVAVVPLGALPVPDSNGVRLQGTVLAPVVGTDFILTIGTIERRKNLPALVRAFAAVSAAHREVHLVIAGGDGDDRPALDRAIAHLDPSAARRVVLTGRVDDPTKGWLLRNASVLAYPSLDEGFGFPLLDAMQVGVPVVASDAGSIPEVAGDAALLGPAGDVDGLADRLGLVLRDSGVRQRLVSAGTARVGQHAWTATERGLLDLYRQLSDRR